MQPRSFYAIVASGLFFGVIIADLIFLGEDAAWLESEERLAASTVPSEHRLIASLDGPYSRQVFMIFTRARRRNLRALAAPRRLSHAENCLPAVATEEGECVLFVFARRGDVVTPQVHGLSSASTGTTGYRRRRSHTRWRLYRSSPKGLQFYRGESQKHLRTTRYAQAGRSGCGSPTAFASSVILAARDCNLNPFWSRNRTPPRTS